MKMKTGLAACLLCLVMAMLLTTFVATPAYAAPKPLADDGPKTGLGEVFKARAATGVGPTKAQMFLTVTATIIMIGVVKYL